MKELPNDDEAKVTLQDFVLPELVTAFREAYEPLQEWDGGCEIMTYTNLRHFFKALVVPLGDPFSIYVQMLGDYGFKFKVDIATGEPVMYVRPKLQ